jgi:hypothetical protein
MTEIVEPVAFAKCNDEFLEWNFSKLGAGRAHFSKAQYPRYCVSSTT